MALSHVHFFLPFRPASIPTTDIPTGKQRLIATKRCSDHRFLWLVEQDMAAGIYHFINKYSRFVLDVMDGAMCCDSRRSEIGGKGRKGHV